MVEVGDDIIDILLASLPGPQQHLLQVPGVGSGAGLSEHDELVRVLVVDVVQDAR